MHRCTFFLFCSDFTCQTAGSYSGVYPLIFDRKMINKLRLLPLLYLWVACYDKLVSQCKLFICGLLAATKAPRKSH